MKILSALLIMVSFVTHAQIGAYNIATAQAKRVNEANNAEQQRIASAATDPAHPNAAAPAPADPVLEATLKNISGLQADFTALNDAAADSVAPAQKAALLNDLSTAALGKKPAASSVQKLAGNLIAATGGKKNPAVLKLARSVHALFNGSHLTTAQQTMVLADVKKNLIAAGASAVDADNVCDDLKGIVEDTR